MKQTSRRSKTTTYKNSEVDKGQRVKPLVPLTENQSLYINAIEMGGQIIGLGPSGSGKSYIPATIAANKLLLREINRVIITRPAVSVGKSLGALPGPQPLWAQVLTPNGWVSMGSIKVGDFVIGSDGKPKEVLGVYPKGMKKISALTTKDGRKTYACDDHLWYTTTWEQHKRGNLGSVKTTKDIAETLLTKKGKLNHYLPHVSPVHFTGHDLPIPPYSLGALLGDGCFGDAICLTAPEHKVGILERCAKELNQTFQQSVTSNGVLHYFRGDYYSNKKPYAEVAVSGRWTNTLKQAIDDLCLLKKTSSEKFIPEIYLTASIKDRIDLLRGLMDTDGSVKKNGESVFHTSSKMLALGVQEIVRSLGGNSYIRDRGVRNGNSLVNGRLIQAKLPAFDVSVSLADINPFYNPVKAKWWKESFIHGQRVETVEYIGEDMCQCILVDSEDHLYVTSDYILTHNTLEEKFEPWLGPILSTMEKVLTKNDLDTNLKNGNILYAPLEYMRGASYEDAMVIVDEAQNLTVDQAIMLVTRIGEDCTLVLNGDVRQSDLKETSGLTKLIHLCKKYNINATVVEFDLDDIVRSDVCKQWVTALYEEGLL